MNLGGLFSGLNSFVSGGGKDVRQRNRTILIVLVVIIVIFGFGYGRGMFGGLGRASGASQYGGAYGGYADLGYAYPRSKRNKKHHHHHRNNRVAFEYSEYGYAAPQNSGYSPFGAGYGSGRGSFFGNDWFFIIAILALLFLLGDVGEQTSGTETSNASIS